MIFLNVIEDVGEGSHGVFFVGLFLSGGDFIGVVGDFCEWWLLFFHNLIIGVIESLLFIKWRNRSR